MTTSQNVSRLATLGLALALWCGLVSARAQSDDLGWPRMFSNGTKQLTVYQPQVDYWHGYTNTHFRCAIAVKGVLKEERFGVAEIDAITVVDQVDRVVHLVPTRRELRFQNASESELALLRSAVDDLRPPGQLTTISLDRVLAYLNPAEQPVQRPVEVNLQPPKIFYSSRPAIMVMLMGEPQFKPVETNRMDLLFALNTNWDLFYDPATQLYYLLNGDNWLSATGVKGPWSPAGTLPPSLLTLPANDNWTQVRQNVPGKRATVVPNVFVTLDPAELIVTHGAPSYTPIQGTRLFRVANTDSVLFTDSTNWKFYFLVAGRWFVSSSLDGPWSAASAGLPADFSRIPDSDPSAFVKASVPGTRDASDAVLLASIPTTTAVSNTTDTVKVAYNGAPQFAPIETTTVQYAVNTPQQVFLVGGQYYCCDAGVWFVSSYATGPWYFSTVVPPAIYTIPVSSPYYNVTYVTVQSYTPTTVVYSQTAGYSGEYVAATGVLMFGAGMAIGAAIAANNSYYCPPYPCLYSYGCCATYHYGYGGYYYGGGAAYGPYGGAGYATAYNPATGTYSRSSYAYGPYGSATAHATYNPYTGGYSRSVQVNTPYGSAGRAAGYNPSTGTYGAAGYRSTAYGTAAASRTYNPYSGTSTARAGVSGAYGSASGGTAYNSQTGARAEGGQVSTATGSAGRAAAYNPTTGNSAQAAYRSGQYGSASEVRTSQGSSAASWNTANGQAAVGKNQSGDMYAGKDGTVYQKDPNGNWSKNTGSGWQSMESPQQQAQAKASSYQQQGASQSSTKQPSQSQAGSSESESRASSYERPQSSGGESGESRQSMESQSQSRSWANQQHESAQSWRSSGAGGRSYGGGGRRR